MIFKKTQTKIHFLEKKTVCGIVLPQFVRTAPDLRDITSPSNAELSRFCIGGAFVDCPFLPDLFNPASGFWVQSLVLLGGEQSVGQDAEDQSAGDVGDVDLANTQCHAANAGDQNRGNGEQIAVFIEIHLLDHLQAGNSDKAVERDTDTTHDAAGNGIQERHEGAKEGDGQTHDGSGSDGDDGCVAGDSHAANGLTISGIGAAAEDSAGHGADTIAQQGAVQTGILQQILTNDGRQVFMVSKMLGKHHEGHGNVCHGHGSNIIAVELLHALHGGKEGELGHRKNLHVLKESEVDHLQCIVAGNIADDGENGSYSIAGENTNDKGNEFDHLLAVGGNQNHHKQSNHGADQRHPDTGIHNKVGRNAECCFRAVRENIVDGGTGQRKANECNGGTDDGGGHDLVDPLNAGKLNGHSNSHVHKACKSSTDNQTRIAQRHGHAAGESCQHGADKGKGRAQKHGAAEFGEELVNNGADARTKEGCRCGHIIAHNGGNGDGSRQNGQKLLDGEYDELSEFGFVLNAVDQIHEKTPFFLSACLGCKKGPFLRVTKNDP